MDGSRQFQFYCDACRDWFDSTLEYEQQGSTTRPVRFLSWITLPNECNWTILEVETGSIAWVMKGLPVYLFRISHHVFTDYLALEYLDKVGNHHPRAQRWLLFLDMYLFTLQYSKGTANSNMDFLLRLPVSATDSNVDRSSQITHKDVDVYSEGAPGVWPRLRYTACTSDLSKPFSNFISGPTSPPI